MCHLVACRCSAFRRCLFLPSELCVLPPPHFIPHISRRRTPVLGCFPRSLLAPQSRFPSPRFPIHPSLLILSLTPPNCLEHFSTRASPLQPAFPYPSHVGTLLVRPTNCTKSTKCLETISKARSAFNERGRYGQRSIARVRTLWLAKKTTERKKSIVQEIFQFVHRH